MFLVLFAQTIRAGRLAIIPLYAADVVGLDVQGIGLIVSLASAVDMSLFAVAGWLMDHLGRKFSIVPSFAIQALGMFLVPFTGSFGTLLLASMLIGLGNGIGAGTMMTLGADLSPPESRGEFLGIWRLIGDTGAYASHGLTVNMVGAFKGLTLYNPINSRLICDVVYTNALAAVIVDDVGIVEKIIQFFSA